MGKHKSEKTKLAALELMKSGLPAAVVAKRFRVSNSTIHYWARKLKQAGLV